jgi:hypothetical protein
MRNRHVEDGMSLANYGVTPGERREEQFWKRINALEAAEQLWKSRYESAIAVCDAYGAKWAEKSFKERTAEGQDVCSSASAAGYELASEIKKLASAPAQQ